MPMLRLAADGREHLLRAASGDITLAAAVAQALGVSEGEAGGLLGGG